MMKVFVVIPLLGAIVCLLSDTYFDLAFILLPLRLGLLARGMCLVASLFGRGRRALGLGYAVAMRGELCVKRVALPLTLLEHRHEVRHFGLWRAGSRWRDESIQWGKGRKMRDG
jgi:hypothetical protein